MKRNPYRAAFAAMTLALLVACSPAAPAADSPVDAAAAAKTALDSAMQADRDFAAMIKTDGLKPAFLKYMDPTDSQFIEAGVVSKGAEQIAAGFDQSPPGFTLEWAPDGGHAAASGDLATTTGRYAVKMDAATLAVGRYLTVWRKDAAGDWKVVADTTIADPPAAPAAEPAAPPG